jgi:hypothetical protein
MLKFYLRFFGPKFCDLRPNSDAGREKVVIIGGAIQGAELAEFWSSEAEK